MVISSPSIKSRPKSPAQPPFTQALVQRLSGESTLYQRIRFLRMLQCMSIPPCVQTTQTCPLTGLEVRSPKQVSRGQKPRCWQGCGPSRGPSGETASWPSQPLEVPSPQSWGPSDHRQSWQQHPLTCALSPQSPPLTCLSCFPFS